MEQFRFFQISQNSRVNTLLNSVRMHLNSTQDLFEYHFFDDHLKEPSDFKEENNYVETERIEKFVEAQIKKLKIIGQYPIIICPYKFEDDLFSVYGPDYAIISMYYWSSFPAPVIKDHIIMAIIDMTLNLYSFDLAQHNPHIGCPSDYGAYGDFRLSLNKCQFCEECSRRITKAAREGKLPLKHKAAIFKILDSIGKRKKCFVLMAFHKSFDEIYRSAIKKVVCDNEWTCQRADEIQESREIMAIIEENILRADLIIADLTGRNPNVFYEVGYAHAVGKNTVLITQSINDVPFDLRHHHCIEYIHSAEGLEKLAQSLKVMAR